MLEGIKRILYHPISPESSVTAETCWWDPVHDSWHHDKRNFFFKFTTATFMHKKVMVINVTDTTDRDSLITAQASSDYKSKLLSSVSHELRTPLNGSINFIEQTLNDETISTHAKEKWLVPALRSNRLLLSLVNDILDFSQMHAGKLRLVFEPGNIVSTAKECMELLEIQAAKKGLNFTLQNNLTTDREIVITDHNRLRQVILNLLSNAVKFTFKGSVKLTLAPTPLQSFRESMSSIERDSDVNGVRVICQDTGIGISKENQKRLFQAFEKLDLGNRATINATGAGLGLIISNNLVQRLSPESLFKESRVIRFESKEEVGTTFYFDVYSQKATSATKLHASDSEEFKCENSKDNFFEKGIRLKNIELLNREITPRLVLKKGLPKDPYEISPYSKVQKFLSTDFEVYTQTSTTANLGCKCPPVLIVDDDPFNLTALEQILAKLQVRCHWAFNGREALEKIQTRQVEACSSSCQQYKIVFLDCSMPILDGFETSKLLRQMIKKGEISDMKIIACTAFVQQSDEDKAKAAGMDAFCTKPIKLEAIREKLKLVGHFE